VSSGAAGIGALQKCEHPDAHGDWRKNLQNFSIVPVTVIFRTRPRLPRARRVMPGIADETRGRRERDAGGDAANSTSNQKYRRARALIVIAGRDYRARCYSGR